MTWLQRLDNFFFTTPRIIWRLGSVESVVNEARAKYGVPPTMLPNDRWIGHEILFCSSWAFEWAVSLPPTMHVIGPMFRSGELVAPLTDAELSFLAKDKD